MTIIRVIPPITDPNHLHVIRNSSPNPELRVNAKSRDHGKTVESKQSSVEIASVMYDNFEIPDQNKERHQDICVETEVIEPSKDLPSLTLQKDISMIVTDDSQRSNLSRVKDDDKKTMRGDIMHEKLLSQVERSCESFEWKQNGGDRMVEVEEEKFSSWWKDGRQTILQFFARILGKRARMGAKGPQDRVLPTSKQHGERVKRVSRGNKSHNRRRRGDIDRDIRLKRVSNGYIVNHACRNESRYRSVTENKSLEEEQRPSIFVRQIQRTRDKNLRVRLLERELCAHLPKKNDVHLAANGTVNIRQLSSPLC